MNTPQRLAQYVQPPLHEARIAHQWAKISNASRRNTRPRARLVPAFAVALFLCGTFAVGWHWLRGAAALNGTVVESGSSGLQAVTLPDKSRIELGPASRLVIDEYSGARVQLSLKKGKANFEVAHQTRRPFAVLAADLEIFVVGTRFTVALGPESEPQRVTVQVEQGKVNVRNRHSTPDERVLAAGQSWSADGSVENNPPVVANDTTTEDALQDASVQPTPANPESEGPTNSLAAGAASASKSSPGAKDLFEAAELARINGNLRASADSLNKLRKSYRSDPRAGLAAFELGRMRMDIFGDVNGSLDALKDAVRLSPNAPFREDAQARLIQLYNRQGNLKACQTEKTVYLAHFPKGAARKVVDRLCEP